MSLNDFADIDPLLPPKKAGRMLGVARETVWRWTKCGMLPQPIRITARKVGWRRSTLEQFIADREKASA